MIKIDFKIFVIIAIIVYMIARSLSYWKSKKVNIGREVFLATFFLYFLGVVYFTFFPFVIFVGEPHHGYINLEPLVESLKVLHNDKKIGLINILGNIALLYPLGIFLPILYKNKDNFKSLFQYGIITTLTIEFIQYVATTRIADVDDVIFNVVGCILGYMSYKLINLCLAKYKIYHNIRSTNKNLIANMIFFIMPIIIVFFTYCKFEEKKYYIDNTLSREEVRQAINSKPIESYVEVGDEKITLTKELYGIELNVYNKEKDGRYSTYSTLNQYKDIGFILIKDKVSNENKLVVFGQNTEGKSLLRLRYSKNSEQDITGLDIFMFVLDADEYEDVGKIEYDFE